MGLLSGNPDWGRGCSGHFLLRGLPWFGGGEGKIDVVRNTESDYFSSAS